MPKARDYHLTEQQLAEIEKSVRHDKLLEERQFCTIIRLLQLGQKPEEVATMHAVSIPTAYAGNQTLATGRDCWLEQQTTTWPAG